MNWYYFDGVNRVGPLNETEWAEAVRTGKIKPETLVWQQGMEKWTPFSQVPPPEEPKVEPPDLEELADETLEAPEAFAARVVDLDYPVNVGGCISRAWEVFKTSFWMFVGAAFFIGAVLLAASKLPILQIFVSMALQGVFMGGLYSFYLRLMRGESCEIVDLFVGFTPKFFKPLALQTLVAFFILQLCLLPAGIATALLGFNIPAPDVAAMPPAEQEKALLVLFQSFQATLAADPQKTLIWLIVILACSIPAVYFTFCWMFAIPLIVDKRMAFWPAMQLSRNKVLQHPWRIGVLSIVALILGFSGFIGFGIGIIFTFPLYFLIKLFLYEDMFSQPPQKSAETE